jgi:site-specific recombinase XerD
MAQDYLRPAAVKAGVLAPDDRRRFGFHNLRHSLASYLVTQTKTDVKTVQSMLRHADIGTTLDIYTHAHCCPVKSRTESIGCRDRVSRERSRMGEVPVQWAFSRKE